MGRTSKKVEKRKSSPPAQTLEGREDQLIALAVDMAEEQLENRTASAQVLCHYLKLATTKTQLEKAKLEHENLLLQAKTETLQSQKRTEELYQNALAAMRSYSGSDPVEYDVNEKDL